MPASCAAQNNTKHQPVNRIQFYHPGQQDDVRGEDSSHGERKTAYPFVSRSTLLPSKHFHNCTQLPRPSTTAQNEYTERLRGPYKEEKTGHGSLARNMLFIWRTPAQSYATEATGATGRFENTQVTSKAALNYPVTLPTNPSPPVQILRGPDTTRNDTLPSGKHFEVSGGPQTLSEHTLATAVARSQPNALHNYYTPGYQSSHSNYQRSTIMMKNAAASQDLSVLNSSGATQNGPKPNIQNKLPNGKPPESSRPTLPECRGKRPSPTSQFQQHFVPVSFSTEAPSTFQKSAYGVSQYNCDDMTTVLPSTPADTFPTESVIVRGASKMFNGNDKNSSSKAPGSSNCVEHHAQYAAIRERLLQRSCSEDPQAARLPVEQIAYPQGRAFPNNTVYPSKAVFASQSKPLMSTWALSQPKAVQLQPEPSQTANVKTHGVNFVNIPYNNCQYSYVPAKYSEPQKQSALGVRGYSMPPRTMPLRTHPVRNNRMSMINSLAYRAKEWVDATRSRVLSSFGTQESATSSEQLHVVTQPQPSLSRRSSFDAISCASHHPVTRPVQSVQSANISHIQPPLIHCQQNATASRTAGSPSCTALPCQSILLPRRTVPSAPHQYAHRKALETDTASQHMCTLSTSSEQKTQRQPFQETAGVVYEYPQMPLPAMDVRQSRHQHHVLQKTPFRTQALNRIKVDGHGVTTSVNSAESQESSTLSSFNLKNPCFKIALNQNPIVPQDLPNQQTEPGMQLITRMPLPKTPKPKNRLKRSLPKRQTTLPNQQAVNLNSVNPSKPARTIATKVKGEFTRHKIQVPHTPAPMLFKPETHFSLSLLSAKRSKSSDSEEATETLTLTDTPAIKEVTLARNASTCSTSAQLPSSPDWSEGNNETDLVHSSQEFPAAAGFNPKNSSLLPLPSLSENQEQLETLIEDVKRVVRQAEQLQVTELQRLLTHLLSTVEELSQNNVGTKTSCDSSQLQSKHQTAIPQDSDGQSVTIVSPILSTTEVNARVAYEEHQQPSALDCRGDSPGEWRRASYIPPSNSLCDSWLNVSSDAKAGAVAGDAKAGAVAGDAVAIGNLRTKNADSTKLGTEAFTRSPTEDDSWETDDDASYGLNAAQLEKQAEKQLERTLPGSVLEVEKEIKRRHLEETCIHVTEVEVLTETYEPLSIATVKNQKKVHLAVIQEGSFGTVS